LLLATPVGQLAMQPYGPLESATRLWEAAGSADTYDARMALLLAARDAEVWTPDMRAKTPMNDILRQTAAAHDDVSMCDIERAFLDQQLPFDGSMFTDPVHFSAEGRRHLAEGFVACLDEVLPRR
jgi:lysophospholipase L1-like esterase